ncbi:Lrp/AsnC family transcriptional regulator [Metapseudomonas otitidis]
MNLDQFDLALLEAVQRDATTSQLELGLQVNLSSAAVNRRLKKLNADGVIQRTVAQVNPAALGYSLTVITEVEVESERLDLLDDMKKAFLACPQVQQCYYVAGECDFVLVMVVRDMDQYTQLTRELFFESNNVKRFKTLVSMSNVKLGSTVPTDNDLPSKHSV